MTRGKTWALSLSAFWLVAVACAQLGNNQSKPTASPNPATAIALSVPNGAIYLIDPATGVRTQLVAGLGDFQDGYAAWSPDRTHLAYGNHGLYILDLSSHKTRLLVPEDQMSMPAWSPSGEVLAYGNGSSLWVAPLNGLPPFQIHIPATLAPVAMAWSEDGIAFQGIRRDCDRSYLCPTTDKSDIWTIQSDATELQQVTHLRRALAPKWSPDSSSILFVRSFASGSRELWVVDADGSHPKQLGTAEDVLAADWSPDGMQIVVARRGLEGATIRLWITDANGTSARPVGGMVQGKDATVDW
jgi:Tol biopolymer transport system component